MRYTEENRELARVVTIEEEQLTSHEAPEMKTAFLKMLSDEYEYTVVNMERVLRMDSTGLGAFLFGIRQAENLDKDMIFCCLNKRIASLVKIAHLSDIIEMYDTVDEALAAVEEDYRDLRDLKE